MCFPLFVSVVLFCVVYGLLLFEFRLCVFGVVVCCYVFAFRSARKQTCSCLSSCVCALLVFFFLLVKSAVLV